ncbi:MAG TPA: citrate/2-methylcitrate synthase [Chloroflexota bacterium]|nr:citrate/2-methylcitrate synthase [Chloroflexota bacterium]
MTQTAAVRGLEGVIAASTAVSHVYGEEGRLVYRGYDIYELAGKASFEEVAYLLWNGELPTSQQLRHLKERLSAHRGLGSEGLSVLQALSNDALPMDVLRTVVSTVGLEERVADRQKGEEALESAIVLTAVIPTILAAFDRRRRGLEPVEPRTDLDHAQNYLYMLRGSEPSPADSRALDMYFVLLADHGMNASTFTARVIASTEADMASAVVGAIGALKGPLHGGAPSLVLDMLDAIEKPENAEPWMRGALSRGDRLMGFGHRVYKAEDPRAEILRRLASEMDQTELFSLASAAEKTGLRLLEEQKPGRRLYTNVEFYSSVVLNAVGLPRDLFTATFAASRTAGWSAHVLEQYGDNRLIRPQSQYTGPQGKRFEPLERRG